jgi:predicted XRE-type DNA-binding protein
MTERVSESVWDALEDSPTEAENMKLRSILMIAISEAVTGRHLPQGEAAKRLGVTQPCLNDILRGRVGKFDLDTWWRSPPAPASPCISKSRWQHDGICPAGARRVKSLGRRADVFGDLLCGVPRFLFSDFPLGNAAGRPHGGDRSRRRAPPVLRQRKPGVRILRRRVRAVIGEMGDAQIVIDGAVARIDRIEFGAGVVRRARALVTQPGPVRCCGRDRRHAAAGFESGRNGTSA